MIIIPLPHYGFDPTEAAVPWCYLKKQDVEIVFATPDGQVASADSRLLTGKGFGLFKRVLMAETSARDNYQEMISSDSFKNPITYSEIEVTDYDGILLPGGHDKGMKSYLESVILQKKVAEFFSAKKIIGAICHGTVLVARSADLKTGKSVIYDYQTTALLKRQEMSAYYLTALWLKDYYRTYPLAVEDEVKLVLRDPRQFKSGRFTMRRDSLSDNEPAFVVQDRNYISARWPGDAHTFVEEFYRSLEKKNESSIL